MSSLPPQPLDFGSLQFYDDYTPTLAANAYTLTIQQSIAGMDTGNYFPQVTQDFIVSGPHFAIAPGDIHMMYPPSDGSGIYDTDLPYIVLNRLMLPWEVALAPNPPAAATPWMALLLFAASEITVDPSTNSATRETQVSDLQTPPSGVLGPDLDWPSFTTETMNSACQTITIPTDAFQALVPLIGELPYLAHCRQISTTNQQQGSEQDVGWFSTVLCNRFPAPSGGVYYAQLVSLEGFSDYLDTESFPSGITSVQLVSLASWSFTSIDAPQTFREVVSNLAAGSAALEFPVTIPGDPTPARLAAVAQLEWGYVPISYVLPTGEETWAWYRGPFSPIVPRALPQSAGAATSDQLLIYRTGEGVFDVTYACAWQLGRALAMADPAFSLALAGFRTKSRLLVNLLLQRLRFLGAPVNTDLRQIANSRFFARLFSALIEIGAGNAVTDALARPPNAAAARRPARRRALQNETSLGDNTFEALVAFLAEPEVQSIIQQELTEDLLPVAGWLAGLALLANVPFNHLVPNAAMLPAESIRFFYVDSQWLLALLDGAISIGAEGSLDQALAGVMSGVLAAAVNAVLSEQTGGAMQNLESPLCGALVQSILFNAWPGTTVEALQGTGPDQTQCPTVMMQSLGPGVMLCLFAGTAGTVQISAPPQGIRFGVDSGDILLRDITSNIGAFMTQNGETMTVPASSYYRPPTGGFGGTVIDVTTLQAELFGYFAGVLPAGTTALTPSQFAIQMLQSPEQQRFDATGGNG